MKLAKSLSIEGWYGFFSEDECGHPEEFISVDSLDKAKKLIDNLNEDLKKLIHDSHNKSTRGKNESNT